MRAAAVALLGCAGCYVSAGFMITPAISLAYPTGRVEGGEGSVGDAARARLAAGPHAALAVATREAIAAAGHGDLRLQRRALAMARELAADHDPKSTIAELGLADIVDHLVASEPCPGLADAAATWAAFGDNARAGDTYLHAAKACTSIDAAVAAVAPLKATGKCSAAIAGLRELYPAAPRDAWIAIFDGIAACSDAVTLRRNLAFVPNDVVDDYLSLLAARRQQQLEDERRADEQRLAEEATARAEAAVSSCESECSSAVYSCSASCSSSTECNDRCASLGHACRAGCGGS